MNCLELQGGYKILTNKKLGQGQFGTVYECLLPHQQIGDRSDTAAKCIEKCATENFKTLMDREIDLLKQLQLDNNPYLVKLYDVCEFKMLSCGVEKECIAILMEKCTEDLSMQMKKRFQNNSGYTVAEILNLIAQAVEGYRTLYSLRIIHRDIKPANFLLKKEEIKLSDFGMGRVVEDMKERLKLTKVGTPAYAAPQIFLGQKFSAKADIYSLAVMFYQLLYNEVPVKGKNQKEIGEFYRNGSTSQIKIYVKSKINEDIPQEVLTLLKSMLNFQEEKRIGWLELFEHPLLKGLAKRVECQNQRLATTIQLKSSEGVNMKEQENQQKTQNDKQQNQQEQFKELPKQEQQPQQEQQQKCVIRICQQQLEQSVLDTGFIQVVTNNQAQGLNRAQRVGWMNNFLFIKGQIAIAVVNQLKFYQEIFNLTPFQVACINLCLFGYSYSITMNQLALAVGNEQFLSDENRAALKTETIQFYFQDQSVQILEQKQSIENEHNSQIQQFYSSINEFIKEFGYILQSNSEFDQFQNFICQQFYPQYPSYLKWFRYFYEKFFPQKLMYIQEVKYEAMQGFGEQYLQLVYLLEKLCFFEEEYPISKYQTSSQDLFIPSADTNYIKAQIASYRLKRNQQ